ncbi:MAG: FecR family protein [Pseudolysinimonas sp.]|uniref:FecR family protein n=1 Tax=Pseudolysinimonas sp. TaxID=2680009 RepID=UPI003263E776
MTSLSVFAYRLAAIAAVAALASLSLTACSSGPGNPILRVIAGDATVTDPSGAVVALDKSGAVQAGNLIATSGDDALVELLWPDGSFTRLGADTSFELTGDGARGTLITGRLWNRVSEQGSGSYRIDTDSGQLVAKGTTFVVTCAAECSAAVVEGTVTAKDGTQLTGPASAQFGDGFQGSVPLPWDAVFGDPWAVSNADLDEAAGFASAAASYQDASPTLASLTGGFSGTRTVVSADCAGYCVQYPVIGDVADRHYQFDIDCSGGIPCTGQIVTDVANESGEVHSETVPLSYDGDAFAWELSQTIGYCSSAGTSYGKSENLVTWRFQATEAAVVDDVYLVTSMEGTGGSSFHIVESASLDGCAQFEREATAKSTFAVTRD